MAGYNPKRGGDWNYGGKNWKLSRSKIGLFLECPRCFYIDNKLGTKRVGGPAFLINSTVDEQLKNEFDYHRERGSKHKLQEEYGIDAVPAKHEKIDLWRDNFKGVQHKDAKSGMIVSGAIDDLWVNSKGEHIIVDYKATAKAEPVVELDPKSIYHDGYKRQLEVYQWLVRKNGLKVSDTAYFVYCTGKRDQESFDGVIEFDVKLIPYVGDDSWVQGAVDNIHTCLESDSIPESGDGCEWCAYFKTREEYGE